jgi:hypothetical protein
MASPSPSPCTASTCSLASSPYGYQPSLAANAIFLSVFGAGLIACLVITYITRRWLAFSTPVAAASLLEVVGYAARLWSSRDPWDPRPYAVSTAFLTVAPAFVAAG